MASLLITIIIIIIIIIINIIIVMKIMNMARHVAGTEEDGTAFKILIDKSTGKVNI